MLVRICATNARPNGKPEQAVIEVVTRILFAGGFEIKLPAVMAPVALVVYRYAAKWVLCHIC
jgi:hypothetical protein